MFGYNEKWNFPKIHFMLTEIYAFDPEMNLHSHFHFNSFPERERERERGREKRESPDRREREEEETSSTSALVDRDCKHARRLTSVAIVRRTRSSIAPLIDRAARRTIALISPSPHDLIFSSAAQSQFDWIWWIFFWVLFLLWMSVELIHYLHVYSWGSVWKIGHVKHFL